MICLLTNSCNSYIMTERSNGGKFSTNQKPWNTSKFRFLWTNNLGIQFFCDDGFTEVLIKFSCLRKILVLTQYTKQFLKGNFLKGITGLNDLKGMLSIFLA